MARKSRTATADTGDGGIPAPPIPPPPDTGDGGEATPQTTGRYVVIFKEGVNERRGGVEGALNNLAGLREVMSSADFAEAGVAADDLENSTAVHFSRLGVAVISEEEAVQALAVSLSDNSDSPIEAIEPEYIAYPSPLSADYLRGFRDAANHLYEESAGGEESEAIEAEVSAFFQDTGQFTWGLQATRAHTSPYTGQGIKLAVLDTGLDLQHPDYRGRAVTSRSFVNGVPVQDVFGHGTHCIGTACGSARPATGVRRYGVATQAHIFVGKVFDNGSPRPSAPTISVIAGIEWALANGCHIASLSLGIPIDQRLLQYETPIQRALNAGLLVIAAAGNNASRPVRAGFVEPPANANAAVAVAAIDSRIRIARFSARSSFFVVPGGLVNIAAPGVEVFSSVPVANGSHAHFQGTSMATPHVSGIAALWAQATGERGVALWNRVARNVRALNIPSADVGAGFVQAPQ